MIDESFTLALLSTEDKKILHSDILRNAFDEVLRGTGQLQNDRLQHLKQFNEAFHFWGHFCFYFSDLGL